MKKDFDEKVLHSRITKTRERRGMNQAKLAEEAHITPAANLKLKKALESQLFPFSNGLPMPWELQSII